ncbi:hypothetical protein CC2G_001940 [Coprinopsis cinerea AmutBmut pab1-1]|nr:hypothetical protein CC2G_001940 [Coprinopsis cinerea AmutBmut pab1-1]
MEHIHGFESFHDEPGYGNSDGVVGPIMPTLTVTVVSYPNGDLSTMAHGAQSPSAMSSFAGTISFSDPGSSVSAPTSESASSSESPSSILESSPSIFSAPTSGVLGVPTPATSQSEAALATEKAPLYIAIVLGCIVGTAIASAMVACIIRLRQSKRRNAPQPPWSREGDPEADLRARIGTPKHNDLPHHLMPSTHLWNLESDRDVSKSKHPSEHVHSHDAHDTHDIHYWPRGFHDSTFPDGTGLRSYNHPISPYSPAHKPAIRYLPSHLVDETLAGQNFGTDRLDGSFQVSGGSSRGTPRSGVVAPRYRNLEANGDVMDTPWSPSNTPPRSLAKRLRRVDEPSNGRQELETVDNKAPNLTLQERDDQEGWTRTLSTNLVNAFNAVAANIPAFGTVESTAKSDALAAKPLAHSSSRKSVGVLSSRSGGHIERDDSQATEVSELSWTLEETGNGAGVVRLHRSSTSRKPGSSVGNSINDLQIPAVSNFSASSPNGNSLGSEPTNPFPNHHLSIASSIYSDSTATYIKSANLGKTGLNVRPGLSPTRRASSWTSSASSWDSFSSSRDSNQVAEALRTRRTYSQDLTTPPR